MCVMPLIVQKSGLGEPIRILEVGCFFQQWANDGKEIHIEDYLLSQLMHLHVENKLMYE